jgi:hypothetical protein
MIANQKEKHCLRMGSTDLATDIEGLVEDSTPTGSSVRGR